MLFVRAALVALPFLFPWVAGPSASTLQLLFAWACAAALLLWSRAGVARPDGRSIVLAWGLLIAGLVSSILGLLQYYGLAAALVPWTTAPDLGQAYGNLRQRNQFATLLNMALVAWLWCYATSGSVRGRGALWAGLPLLLVAQAASTSRTGLLQLVLTAGVAAFIAHRSRDSGDAHGARRLPPPWALLALIPLYFAAAWLLPRLAGGEVEGMIVRLREGAPEGHSRLVLWRNVLALIAERPWTGWGWGELSFAHYTTLYSGPRFVEILDNAHNLPLHLAVTLGLPAALLLCGGVAWWLLASRPWAEREPARLMVWGLLAMIGLHSLLEYPLWYGPFQLVTGLCLGLLGVWPVSARKFRPNRPPAPVLSTLIAIVLIAIVGYAGWDYTRVSQIYLPREARLPAYRDDTLAKIRPSWLFASEVRFAELALTPVTQANAAAVHALAERTLHFSPEPAVAIKLIESAQLLGREDEAMAHATRLRIAFPADYARWLGGRPALAPGEP